MADKTLLKSAQYFGKYGEITSIIINNSQYTSIADNSEYNSAYITYEKDVSASVAIVAIEILEDKKNLGRLEAGYATTKYCKFFLSSRNCILQTCNFLHQHAPVEDTYRQCAQKGNMCIFEILKKYAVSWAKINYQQILSLPETHQRGPFPSIQTVSDYLLQKINPAGNLKNPDQMVGPTKPIKAKNQNKGKIQNKHENRNLEKNQKNENGSQEKDSTNTRKYPQGNNEFRADGVNLKLGTCGVNFKSKSGPNQSNLYNIKCSDNEQEAVVLRTSRSVGNIDAKEKQSDSDARQSTDQQLSRFRGKDSSNRGGMVSPGRNTESNRSLPNLDTIEDLINQEKLNGLKKSNNNAEKNDKKKKRKKKAKVSNFLVYEYPNDKKLSHNILNYNTNVNTQNENWMNHVPCERNMQQYDSYDYNVKTRDTHNYNGNYPNPAQNATPYPNQKMEHAKPKKQATGPQQEIFGSYDQESFNHGNSQTFQNQSCSTQLPYPGQSLPNGSSYPSENVRNPKKAIHQDPRPPAPRSPPGQTFTDPEYYPYQHSSYPYHQSSYPQPQSQQQPQWAGPSGHDYPSEQNHPGHFHRDDYHHTREYREIPLQYGYSDLNYPTKPSPQDGYYHDYGYAQSYDPQTADYGYKQHQHPGYQLHAGYGEMPQGHPAPMYNRRPYHEEVADGRFMEEFRNLSFDPQNNGQH